MSTATEKNNESTGDAMRELVQDATESLAHGCRDCTEHYVTEPAKDLLSLGKEYAKEKPEVAAAWAFVVGVMVGWKIKPW